MKPRILLALVFTLAATPVHAQGGMNLSWNDCGTFGQMLETFACNTNVGVHRMYVSFVSPFPLTQLVGIEVSMDVAYSTGVIPSWWTFMGTGACRLAGTLSGNMNFLSGPYSCGDPWQGQAVGGVDARPKPGFPNLLQLRGVAAVPSTAPATVDDVTEYYGVEFRISNSRTTGVGSCAGCDVPACLLLTRVTLYQPVGVGDYVITQPITNTLLGWQCPAFNGTPTPMCFQCPVPGKSKSWGSIKGMYR